MNNASQEIRATIARLKREGEYERYLSQAMAEEVADIAAAVQAGLELTDEEIHELVGELPGGPEASSTELEEEAKQAIARVIARRAAGSPPLVDRSGGDELASRKRSEPST